MNTHKAQNSRIPLGWSRQSQQNQVTQAALVLVNREQVIGQSWQACYDDIKHGPEVGQRAPSTFCMRVHIPTIHTSSPKGRCELKIVIYGYFLLIKQMSCSWHFIKMAWWIDGWRSLWLRVASCLSVSVCLARLSKAASTVFERQQFGLYLCTGQLSLLRSLETLCAQPCSLVCAYCHLHSGWHRILWIWEEVCHYDCKI